ncbi:MAG: bifunctional folylpolyglutamate synthase/dihydrofolate synthase [Candidatus Omnitrophota bacterium]|nr:MAG: bifunctional folylpolyglutamate synthase/dihydrofolate synthase [Candidatus Omnitrophota bacterium]
MNYREALQYLDSFIDYEKIGYKNRESFSLSRMRCLAQIFDNPQNSFPAIHIAGTKGKGSIVAFISNILKEAGFTVGVYTSPHLTDARERIKINNEIIAEAELAFYAGEIKRKLDGKKHGFSPTFFEIYTVLAFNYFKAKKINYGVIEAGLGGRLDATNIIKPLVSLISPISYDHTHILGESLKKIAIEKSGIIKKGCVSISAPQENSVLEVIREKCKSLDVEFILVGKNIRFCEITHDSEKEIFDLKGALGNYENCQSRLLGRHQIINAACAAGIAESLAKRGVKISDESIKKGIEITENPGRCEVIARNPYIILDGAQNRASANALKETIRRNFDYKKLILILGASKKKDIKGIVEELSSLSDMLILTKANIERREEPRVIAGFIKEKDVILTDSVTEALRRARALASVEDMILITGSFFVIGEAKKVKFEEEKLSI